MTFFIKTWLCTCAISFRYHWDVLVKDYIPPEITAQTYSSLLIPNVSSIRTEFLIDLVAKQKRSVLLMGEQGSAKTTMINAHLKKLNSENHVLMSCNFSSTTTPQLYQKQVNTCVHKFIPFFARLWLSMYHTGRSALMVTCDNIHKNKTVKLLPTSNSCSNTRLTYMYLLIPFVYIHVYAGIPFSFHFDDLNFWRYL